MGGTDAGRRCGRVTRKSAVSLVAWSLLRCDTSERLTRNDNNGDEPAVAGAQGSMLLDTRTVCPTGITTFTDADVATTVPPTWRRYPRRQVHRSPTVC